MIPGLPKCWQILFHGRGFELRDDEGEPMIGFYTVRRIVASSAEEAESRALRGLLGETKIRLLISQSDKGDSVFDRPKIIAEKTHQISWARWLLGSYAKGLVLYGRER